MKPELLATLRAAGEAATKGPWSAAPYNGGCQIDAPGVDDCIAEMSGGSNEDAEFVALARNHWDELLDAVEERDRLRDVVRDVLVFLHDDSSLRWDVLAERFYRVTGVMAPGKSMPLEMAMSQPSDDARATAYRAWLKGHLASLYTQALTALGEQEETP